MSIKVLKNPLGSSFLLGHICWLGKTFLERLIMKLNDKIVDRENDILALLDRVAAVRKLEYGAEGKCAMNDYEY